LRVDLASLLLKLPYTALAATSIAWPCPIPR
jgi:hypothetical protein